MSNFLFIPETYFIDATPTASSENASYPDDNITGYAHPAQEYRSANTSETTIVLDTGTPDQAIEGIYIGGVNFTSMYLAASNTTSWATPDFGESAKTIALDKVVQRRKGLFVTTGWDGEYLRIRIPNQATTDSETFFRIGVVILFSNAVEMPVNPDYGYERGAPREYHTRKYPGGGRETLNLGLYDAFTSDMILSGTVSEVEDFVWDYIKKPSPGSAYVLYENGWRSGGTEKTYLVEIENPEDIRVKAPNYNEAETNSIRLIERIN